MHAFLAWVNRDLWGPIWPNLAASAICAALAVARVKTHLRKHHEAIRDDVRKALSPTTGEPTPR